MKPNLTQVPVITRHSKAEAAEAYAAAGLRVFNGRLVFAGRANHLLELSVPPDSNVQGQMVREIIGTEETSSLFLLINAVPVYESTSCPDLWAAICASQPDPRELWEAPCFEFAPEQQPFLRQVLKLCMLEWRDFLVWSGRPSRCFRFSHDDWLSICSLEDLSPCLQLAELPRVKVLWQGELSAADVEEADAQEGVDDDVW